MNKYKYVLFLGILLICKNSLLLINSALAIDKNINNLAQCSLNLLNKKNSKIEIMDNLQVVLVYDGDTVLAKNINNENEKFKIRLLGIQAPEIFKNNSPEPYGIEAKEYLTNLILNKKIFIILDKKTKKDKYNRLLGIVCEYPLNSFEVDDSVNEKIIKQSLAYVYILDKNIVWLKSLITAENNVIKEKNNIWSNEKYKVIKPENAKYFIGEYKVIDARVLGYIENPKSIFLYLEIYKSLGLAIKIDKKLFKNYKYTQKEFLEKIISNPVRVRGFINKKSKNFGPLISIINMEQLDF